MKVIVLLVFAVVVLVDSSLDCGNLKAIISKLNESDFSKCEDFVPYVKYDHGCGKKFFCKVQDILQEERNCQNRTRDFVVRNLEVYFSASNINCTALPEKMNSSNVTFQMKNLMSDLTHCSKHAILHNNCPKTSRT